MTDQDNNLKQQLKRALRIASSQQLEQFTGKVGFKIDELHSRFQLGQVLSDQIILLVISGDDLRMTIKIHYKRSHVLSLAKYPFDFVNDDELQLKIVDYMKELCNQVCGRVCRIFAKRDIHLGMSIPLKLRGFYEVYSDYHDATSPLFKFGDFWQVSNTQGSFFFSSYIEIVNLNTLYGITFDTDEDIDKNEQQDDSQGLEFL